jgi:putative peptidoglycan lipid II flippase
MGGFLASKVLGLVRNIVIGSQYGASRDYETFLAAISIPDTVFQVLAGGSVGAAFIPVFASYLTGGNRDHAWRLTSALMNLAVLCVGLVSLLLALLAPFLMQGLVAGWSAEDQAQAAHLTRILLVAPAVFAISTLATSALNGVKHFALAAAAPLMYNLMLIFGAVVLRDWGVEGLAFSAVLGAFLHLGIQIPGLARVGMKYTPTLGLDLPGTHEVARLMGPRVLALGVSQINQLVNVALASFLVAGSVAYLNYAWLILMAPLGVFAMGFSTAIFPTLAEQSATSRDEEQRQTFLFGLRFVLFGTVPATVLLLALAQPIVGLVLERGAFEAAHTAATAFALGWFAIGLPGHALIEIVNRMFYAERDTVTPVKIAALAVALNITLSVALMQTPLSFGGLALANSLAALVEGTVLLALLHRRTGWVHLSSWFGFMWRVGSAALVMAAVTWSLRVVTETLLQSAAVPAAWAVQAALVGLITILGTSAYVGIALLLGVAETRRVLALLHRS